MNKKLKLYLFLFLYIGLMILPGLVILLFPMPEWRDFWRELSVILGFVGLAMAGVQFVPVSRLPFFADVVDLDRMYKAHHVLSVTAVFFVLLHPIILLLNNPNVLPLFNIFTAPWRAQAGWIGLFGLLLIAITSVLRKMLKLDYTVWLLLHDIFTVLIAVFGLIHIFKVNHYTSTPAMTIAWIIEIVIWAGLSIYIRLIKPLHLAKIPYKVHKVVPESVDTWSIYLKPDGHKGVPFRAGQVAWINAGKSPFVISRNPFSYSGSDKKKDMLRFSIKNLGNFTATVGDLKPGSRVYVDGPYGTFDLNDPVMQEGLVLLAGGIGVAPALSILNSMADHGDKRPVYLIYGDYNKERLLFTKELEGLKKKLNLEIIYVLEKGADEPGFEKGYITKELLETRLPENKMSFYYFICGPLPMINAMEKHLRTLHDLGIANHQIGSEKYDMA